jgi:RimJ/RimL family protein N-acetyltransferase
MPQQSHIPETERLHFRPLAASDETALFDMFSDPYARQFYPQMAERVNVQHWIQWNLRNYAEFGFGLWALELKASERFIGDCGLTYQEVEGRHELEVGYHILQADRRKGYATEAAHACMSHGFDSLVAPRLCSIVRPDNIASRAVASRIHTDCREFPKAGRPALLFFTERAAWESSNRKSR